MKTLRISHINQIISGSVEKFHPIMNEQEKHSLPFQPWQNEGYVPEVFFSLAHNNQFVLLKFFVGENEIRARVTKTNGPVWEDSCVEFFISFDTIGYYNFEFNCIGTIHASFGNNRNQRTNLVEDVLHQIKSHTLFITRSDHYYWEMIVAIPKEAFIHHSLDSLSGIVCRGNFYKCADGFQQPHYLSWSNIKSEFPNFHVPEFFGKLFFL